MRQKCKRCGYEWGSWLKLPKQCPKCKRYDWNKNKDNKKEEVSDA